LDEFADVSSPALTTVDAQLAILLSCSSSYSLVCSISTPQVADFKSALIFLGRFDGVVSCSSMFVTVANIHQFLITTQPLNSLRHWLAENPSFHKGQTVQPLFFLQIVDMFVLLNASFLPDEQNASGYNPAPADTPLRQFLGLIKSG